MRDLREQAAEHGAHLALLLLPAARLLALGLPRRLLELPLLARLPARGVAALGHVGLQLAQVGLQPWARGVAALGHVGLQPPPRVREERSATRPLWLSTLPIWLHWLRRH